MQSRNRDAAGADDNDGDDNNVDVDENEVDDDDCGSTGPVQVISLPLNNAGKPHVVRSLGPKAL